MAAFDGMLADMKDRIAKVETHMVDGPSDKFDSLFKDP